MDSRLAYDEYEQIIKEIKNWSYYSLKHVSFVGVESEALLLLSKQYCGTSNGSACTSCDYSHSYVFTAMGWILGEYRQLLE